VFNPEDIAPTLAWARREAEAQRVPVVVEVITERVTNIAMGPEIDRITEFEEVVDIAPTAEAVA
jgi:tartronate-semialdehyde synthase